MEKILIFIGARGGSKGVKGKNIRNLLDRPLIAYTIEQALSWGKASRVIVSTDSQEIAAVAKQYGAEVPFLRPDELASDTASKVEAIKHALINCESMYNEKYDIVVDLDVTAPLRTRKDLDKCLELYLDFKPKTLVSVVHAHKNPYFNMVEEVSDGRVALSKTLDGLIYRRQDAPKVYSQNASIYFYSRSYLLESQTLMALTDDTRAYVMDDITGIDIDREIDFKFIEFLIKDKIFTFDH